MILRSPIVLSALVMAATPVVIYFLLRRRRTEIDWGASYLLRLTLTSRRKASIWKQVVVLTLRVLVIALAVLLLAGLLRRNPTPQYAAPALPDTPVHRAIVLDNSLSMSADDGDGSRLTRMCRAVDALLAGLRVGDTASLIPLVADPRAAANGSFTLLHGPCPARERNRVIRGIVLHEDKIRLSPALATAFAAHAQTPLAARELYVLTDLPRELEAGLEELHWAGDAIRDQDVRAAFVNLSGGDDQSANVGISNVEIGSHAALANVPVTVYVTAVNYTDSEAEATFEYEIDGETVTRSTIRFKGNESRRFPLSLTFTRPGNTLLRIRTAQSRLEVHSRRALSIEVRDHVKVWLVAEELSAAAGTEAIRETEFLLRALRHERKADTGIEATETTVQNISRTIPNDVDVIVIAAPQFATSAIAAALEEFVRNGGGLVLAGTDGMKMAGYNEHFARFLPAPLVGPAEAKTKPDRFNLIRTEPEPGASQLFAEFATGAGGDLGHVRVYNHLRLNTDAIVGDVIFRLTNDAPLLLSRTLGRGPVFLYTASLGISWSSMPVRQSAVPFFLRLIHAAMAGRTFPRNLAPGERLIMPWSGSGEVILTAPGGTVREVPTVDWEEQRFVLVDAPGAPGEYRLAGATASANGNEEAHFTVRTDVVEGDLRPLAGPDSKRLAAALGVPVYMGWAKAVEALGPDDAVFAQWPWIVVAILAIYLFETWFVRRI